MRTVAVVDVHLNVRSTDSFFDGVLVRIVSHLLIDEVGSIVDVSELLEGPFNKGFLTADIDGIVHENNGTSLVLIKVALEVILESFQILVPLSREKLQNLTLDVSREILLQVSDTC